MNRLGIFLVLGALIFSLLLTVFIYKYQRQKAVSLASASKINVLVAARNIKAGEVLVGSDVRWQAWPNNALSSTFLIQGSRDLNTVTGAIARLPLNVGEPITDFHIVQKDRLSPLASIIKPGMRAFIIEMDRNLNIQGLITPGDTVDVVLTFSTVKNNSRDKEFVSKTILKKVTVLGIDQNISPKTAETNTKSNQQTKSVTLEVTPKQAEVLAVAKSMGTLSLSLAGAVTDIKNNSQTTATFGSDVKPDIATTPSSQMTDIHGDKINQTGEQGGF